MKRLRMHFFTQGLKRIKGKYLSVRFFPLRATLKHYSWDKFKGDCKAALTVSMVDFPQGIAYALVAGLPIQAGIYASILAYFVGPFFSSARFMMFGPTNSTAALLLSSFLAIGLPKEYYASATALLLLMVGVFLVLAAVLRLGSLIRFVSRSVVSGYVTASLLLIIINQCSHVCGYPVPPASTFIEILKLNLQYLLDIHLPTLFLSALTAGSYFSFKRFLPQIPPIPGTLFLMIGLAWVLSLFSGKLDMLGDIPIGSWKASWPDVNLTLLNQLAQPALAITLLGILETATPTKLLESQGEERISLNQQIFSLGMANLANAFGSGMIVSSSLTRSTISLGAGVRTPYASFISGLLLVLGITLLGPHLHYIPKAALSTIILIVTCSLINWQQIKIIVRSTKSDATVFFLTFISGLIFSLETAIYLGAAASIVLFLKKASVPQLVEFDINEEGELTEKPKHKHKGIPEISIIHVEGDLFFASTDIFVDQASLLYNDPNLKIIILRMRNAHCIDATSALAIAELAKLAREKRRLLILCGVLPDVENMLRNTSLMATIGEENFFPYFPENPNKSTRLALIRAQRVLGIDTKTNIKLFIKADAEVIA